MRIDLRRFAPSMALVRDHRTTGRCDAASFQTRYLDELRALWRQEPALFLDLIDQAKTGDVTLTDDWGNVAHALRRILAAALKQIARTQEDAARQRERRALERLVANPSDLYEGPIG